jgi:mycothiol synthase
VCAARDMADLGTLDHTLEDLLDVWQLSGFDISADARLVEDGAGQVVGYGMVVDDGAFGVIRPEAEGQGAGSALLDWLEQRERDCARAVHRQYVAAANRAGAAFLQSRGYSLLRSNYRMVRALDGTPSVDPPAGVTLRQLQEADVAFINGLDNRAFAQDPGYTPESLTALREEHLEAHDAAPDLNLVACQGDRIVGFLLTKRREDGAVGYVDVLAVDPPDQGRGIGRALLLQAFNDYVATGLREAQLGVSSVNSAALKLYESAGLTPRFQHDIYERPVA